MYVAALAAACALHNVRQPEGQRWWRGWSVDALRDWGPFAKLSVSSTLMIVLDWVRLLPRHEALHECAVLGMRAAIPVHVYGQTIARLH